VARAQAADPGAIDRAAELGHPTSLEKLQAGGMAALTEAGVCSFKLCMAYKGERRARDDALTACMERARDLSALTMVRAENGDIIDLLVTRALGAGDTSAPYHALTRPD